MSSSPTIGRVLRRLRRDAGMSLATLSHRSDVDRHTIRLYEMDECDPNQVTLVRLAKALGTTAAEIARESGVTPRANYEIARPRRAVVPDDEVATVARLRAELARTQDLAVEQEYKLAAYNEELARETARIRAKHDCDAVEAAARDLRFAANELADEATYRSLRLIPTLAFELLAANDASDEGGVLSWLSERGVKILPEHDGASAEARLNVLLAEMTINGVDYVNATTPNNLAAYGIYTLRTRGGRDDEPTVEIHESVVANVGDFAAAVRAKKSDVADETARARKAERRALYEKLRAEFENDQEGG